MYKFLLHDLCKAGAGFLYITLLGVCGFCEIDAINFVLSNVKEEVKVTLSLSMIRRQAGGVKAPPF